MQNLPAAEVLQDQKQKSPSVPNFWPFMSPAGQNLFNFLEQIWKCT